MSENIENNTNNNEAEDLGKLINVRIDKVKEFKDDFGVNSYPYNYDVTNHSEEIKNNFDSYFELEKKVSIAGRIMTQRIMGKASFVNIQDKDGKIQLYVAQKNIGEES